MKNLPNKNCQVQIQIWLELRSYKDYIQDPNTGRMMGRKPSEKPKKRLTKSRKNATIKKNIKYDKKGKPFTYPECTVSDVEYATFISNVNTFYNDRYKGKKWCNYYSGELDINFYFESHGFDDYCIYRKG